MILTIRTDKLEAELALYDGTSQVEREVWLAHRELSDTIHLKIEELFQKNNLNYQDLSGLVFFQGPGSFTGLRIGASVVNALSYSLNIPVVGASGDDWIRQGLDNLLTGKSKNKIVIPNYGSPARTTKPKK